MVNYTFLHFKRRLFGTAYFNVKRQLLQRCKILKINKLYYNKLFIIILKKVDKKMIYN
jgi:hypothetical protein